ncbi:hypothetical protein PFICI_08593 [Pestalotiopsis fici W106-1]|uniref:Rhodopsin domain-containing protein n=1 Tax=Pestalotiopsis fici (strain W106-1 / CGMCC3.15140) TaxID=1229662 RepID=W3WY38_PESFW|nr:uncharacterized protein PFICI_08593 [Pestalotiopsis fici W106-1]ETS78740.1 hypothetical protein PFICI_08593 [Pestalotiopsis fici W106-1]
MAEIENRGPQLLGVDVFFIILALITTLLRIYVRIFMVKSWGKEDWFMLAATTAFVLFCSFSISGVHYGTGRHFADLTEDNAMSAMKCWFFCYLFYATSMICSKLSIGFFLLRITVKKIHIWIVYGAMFFSVLSGIAFFLVTLLQCTPVSFFWERVGEFYGDPMEGTCVSAEVIIGLAALYSTFSVLSDFTFAILPAFLLWDLKIDRRTKFTIIPILAMGCVASSAVVARFPYLPNFRNFDFLFATVDIAIWSAVEQGLAIAAGCLATLRPLLKEVSYRLGWSKPSNGSSGHMSGMMSGTFPNTGGRSRGMSRNLDMYDLSEFTQIDDEESKIGSKPAKEGRFSIPSLRSPKLPPSTTERKSVSTKVKAVSEGIDSEEELSDQQSQKVVVSKEFS